MHALLNVAVMAAHSGGDTLIRILPKLDKIKVEQKGRNDFVSEADRKAEHAVIRTILKHYPDHAILAEESGQQGDSDYVWVIDPLDGTTNFLHGFPVFCVSVGLMHKNRLEHAAVYDPLRQELFTASRGQGAHLDGRRIRVSKQNSLERALIGTGFCATSRLAGSRASGKPDCRNGTWLPVHSSFAKPVALSAAWTAARISSTPATF
jgi:myo-inositol-1(or 4)-monophosphatase